MTDLPRVVMVVDALPAELRDALIEELGEDVRLVVSPTLPTGPDCVAVIIGPETPLTAADVDRLPALRVVAASSTGVDHLDLGAITRAGASVTHVADYCTDEVADHALALVLALLRTVTSAHRTVRVGRWEPPSPGPRRIAGTRLGLVGFGRTARALAGRASALGMVVSAYTRSAAPLDGSGVRHCPRLADLLSGSDVVSLHVPLTAETHRLIDAAALALLPDGAYLVNVSRGGLVDHDALRAALDGGRLAGAALDVLDPEPPRPGDPLLARDDVVITPHIAWDSPAARREVHLQAVRSVRCVLQGGRPPGLLVAATDHREAG